MRHVLLGLVLLSCVLAAVSATRLRFDTSLEVWFLEEDPDLIAYREFLDVFTSDQIIVAAWEDPALFTTEGLAFVDRVSTAGAQIPGVLESRSLTTVRVGEAQPGAILVKPLWDVTEPGDPLALRERVLNDPLFAGRIVAKDGLVTAVALTVEPTSKDSAKRKQMVTALRALAQTLGAERGVSIVLAGPTMLDEAFVERTQSDLARTFPLMLLVIIVVVLALFRTPRALVLPTSVVLISSLWVAGLMGAFDVRITIIHSVVFPMLLGMSVANSMHLQSRAALRMGEGVDPVAAAKEAILALRGPCALTATASALGLLSLQSASLRPLRQLGLLGAGGAVAAFFLTFVLAPYVLPRLPRSGGGPNLEGGTEGGGLWAKWDRLLIRLAHAVQSRPRTVLAASLAVCILMTSGVSRLEMGINPLGYFKDSDPERAAVRFVDERLSGTLDLEVFIDANAKDQVLDPSVLGPMWTLSRELESIPGVGGVSSVVDQLAELRRLARGGAAEERKPPTSRAEVAQLLLMLDDTSEIDRFVDFDRRHARIQAVLRGSDVQRMTEALDIFKAHVLVAFPPPVEADVTGQVRLVRNMERFLLASQVRSIGTAFVTVFLLMIIALRSWRLGMFAMIPNFVPIACVLGLMGWTGTKLDPGTAMTGAVAMGLVVDDTVHFLHHLRERLRAGDDIQVATVRTLVEAGRAAAMTAVVLGAGFFVSMTASFKPNILFGLFTGLTIFLAAAAELILLPAVLMLVPKNLFK